MSAVTNRLSGLNTKSNKNNESSKSSNQSKGNNKSKNKNNKKSSSAAPPKFCHEYNNGQCSRAAGAAFCSLKGMVLLHACNNRVNGGTCQGAHARVDCSK